jgi:hypothetical protein
MYGGDVVFVSLYFESEEQITQPLNLIFRLIVK